MSKVSFKDKSYEEIAILKSIKELQGLKVFSKDTLRTTPILIYIDNPENIVVYSKVGKKDVTRSNI
jgi:hypothetical protein